MNESGDQQNFSHTRYGSFYCVNVEIGFLYHLRIKPCFFIKEENHWYVALEYLLP